MAKAFFARKAVDIEQLKQIARKQRQASSFVIEKVIELPQSQFDEFSQNLLSDCDFIKDDIDLMYVGGDGVWHTILIKAEGAADGICSNFEGYGYARYSAYISDCNLELEDAGYVTDTIAFQIEQIRCGARYNMFDKTGVQREAFEKGYNQLVVFMEIFGKKYTRYILSGER